MRLQVLTLLILCCCEIAFAQQDKQYKITHYDEYDGLSQRYISQIVQGDDGFIWIGTWNGLNRFDGYDFVSFKSCDAEGNRLPSDRFINIVKTADGNLLCQIDSRIYLFDVKTLVFYDILAQIEEKVGQKLKIGNTYHTQTGDIFFECEDKRILTTTDANIVEDAVLHNSSEVMMPTYPFNGRVYSVPELKNMECIYCMTDDSGNDWTRTNFGIYKMLPVHQDAYQELYTDYSSLIRCLYRDKSGRLWVTSKDDKTVRIYDHEQNLIGYLCQNGTISTKYASFGSPVYCIYEDKDQNFWLGSKPDGLFRLKEQKNGFEVQSVIPGTGEDNFGVWDIKEDATGRMWIATFERGLICYSATGEYLGEVLMSKHNAGRLVRHLLTTERQELLVATTEGLFVADVNELDFNKIKFNRHCFEPKRKDCLSNDATMFLFQDHSGTIFVCTESGGVNQIISDNLLAEELSFSHINTSTGFPTDIALSMFEYDDFLGIVSNNQLIRYNPKTKESLAFDNRYFKSDFRFSDAAPLQLTGGKWMFGLQNGAIVLDLQTIKKSDFIPRMAITGVSIQNGMIDYAVNHKDTITLNSDERCLTLYFAALDFAADNNLRYAFSLDNGKWNYLDKNHSVTLLDLKPGTYLLEIGSTNHDQVWVDNERMITIVVTPAWWETVFAKIVYGMLILAFIALVIGVINHIRKINIRQKNLEAYLELMKIGNESQSEQIEQTVEDVELHVLEKAQIKAVDDVFMKRVLAFVEQNIDNPDVNIADMAEAAATSMAGLNRKMKQILGTTPNEFLREARIKKACLLLQDQSVSINDIAYLCGFSDSKYFSRSFKSKMGVSPSDYRTNLLK